MSRGDPYELREETEATRAAKFVSDIDHSDDQTHEDTAYRTQTRLTQGAARVLASHASVPCPQHLDAFTDTVQDVHARVAPDFEPTP